MMGKAIDTDNTALHICTDLFVHILISIFACQSIFLFLCLACCLNFFLLVLLFYVLAKLLSSSFQLCFVLSSVNHLIELL